MTIPIHTATYTVLRPGPTAEKWEPGPLAAVATGVRGNISAGRGVQSETPQAVTTTARYVLALDPFTPQAPFDDAETSGQPLQPSDIVQDEQTGERFSVEFPHFRSLLPHWTAYVIRTDIR